MIVLITVIYNVISNVNKRGNIHDDDDESL